MSESLEHLFEISRLELPPSHRNQSREFDDPRRAQLHWALIQRQALDEIELETLASCHGQRLLLFQLGDGEELTHEQDI